MILDRATAVARTVEVAVESKFCEDCRHFERMAILSHSRCHAVHKSVLTRDDYAFADFARRNLYEGKCGPEAKLFEPKYLNPAPEATPEPVSDRIPDPTTPYWKLVWNTFWKGPVE